MLVKTFKKTAFIPLAPILLSSHEVFAWILSVIVIYGTISWSHVKMCWCEIPRREWRQYIFIQVLIENWWNFVRRFLLWLALTLIAVIAACFVANVTKAQPLLCPFWSRNTVHSSMAPCTSKSLRTSISVSFLFNMPTNNLRSKSCHKKQVKSIKIES